MGKTKTMFVAGATEKKSGKEAYEAKMKAKAAKEAGQVVKSAVEKPAKAGKAKEPKQEAKIEEKSKVVEVESKPVEEEKVESTETSTETETPATEETAEKSKRQKKAKVRSKNYKSAYSKIDKSKFYSIPNSIKLLKEINYSKFDSAVELHLVVKTKGLNVNAKLPFSGGKAKKVEIADDKTVEKLKTGKIDFDILLATADMMPKLVQYARVLGPRGMMPNPKNGTLIKSVKEADKFAGNSLNLKTEKEQPVIHTVIGKLSQADSELEENTKTVIDAVNSKQIVKVYIKSTMSPSIKLAIN